MAAKSTPVATIHAANTDHPKLGAAASEQSADADVPTIRIA